MTRRVFCTLFFLLLLPSSLSANEADIERRFIEAGVDGTLLIESLNGRVKYTHNSAKAGQAHIPASTFKIPNTLIALEEGVITDQFEVIEWDGIERAYAPWNSNQTLATAFARSCVWCYQQFAKEVGDSRYKHYLDVFGYGNKKTGADITTFWLEGNLRVSPNDQIAFLRKVYWGQLPIKASNIQILKEIMLVEEKPAYKLRAKTGWKGADGWYVGYVETENEVWFFAHHMLVNDPADLPLRAKMVIDALKLKGII
ncbi:MAG: class D beta-lactamase [Pseudomonadales bacterium]